MPCCPVLPAAPPLPPSVCPTLRYGANQVPEGDDRTISNLLLDQIEFADVILLNKTDLLQPTKLNGNKAGTVAANACDVSGSKKHRQAGRRAAKAAAAAAGGGGGGDGGGAVVSRLVGMLQQLNPRARVVPTTRCGIGLQEVLLTGLFDMEQVGGRGKGWGVGGGGGWGFQQWASEAPSLVVMVKWL